MDVHRKLLADLKQLLEKGGDGKDADEVFITAAFVVFWLVCGEVRGINYCGFRSNLACMGMMY